MKNFLLLMWTNMSITDAFLLSYFIPVVVILLWGIIMYRGPLNYYPSYGSLLKDFEAWLFFVPVFNMLALIVAIIVLLYLGISSIIKSVFDFVCKLTDTRPKLVIIDKGVFQLAKYKGYRYPKINAYKSINGSIKYYVTIRKRLPRLCSTLSEAVKVVEESINGVTTDSDSDSKENKTL